MVEVEEAVAAAVVAPGRSPDLQCSTSGAQTTVNATIRVTSGTYC